MIKYEITSWGGNKEINTAQNQGLRVITGTIKSTPVNKIETVKGIPSMEAEEMLSS